MQRNGNHQQRSLMIVLIASIFLLSPIFVVDASSSGGTTEGIDGLKNMLFRMGELCSWIRIVLGNLAGKLMTNTLVYGEFMGLDTFLWKGWQIMRTFANYAIGFLFGYSIFKYVLFPSEKGGSLIKTIKELLVASVLVQASWFLVMVIVDISTIALATVSSFPSQVLANSSYMQQITFSEIKANKVLGSAIKSNPEAIEINPFTDVFDKTKKQRGVETIPMTTVINDENLLDQLLPQSDNLAGPLTYLGFSVFKTHDFLRDYKISDANTVQKLTKVVISLMFDAGMIILFSFALAVLVIVLIVRLVYLWIFIIASPIIMLIAVTKVIDLGKVSEFLDIKKILNLIFKPVIFALWISIMMIVIIVMQGFFSIGSGNFNDALIIVDTPFPIEENNTARYTSEIQISKFAKVAIYQGTKSFRDIIISLITLAMMRYLVKLAITSKTGTSIDKFTRGVVEVVGKGLGNIGIVPTPMGRVGFNQVWRNGSSPLLNVATDTYMSKFQEKEGKDKKKIAKMFGVTMPISSLTAAQAAELNRSVMSSNDPSAFPNLIKDFKSKNEGIKFAEIKPYIPQWIAKHQNTRLENLKAYLGDKFMRADPDFEDKDKRDKALDNLFKDQQIFQTFYKNVLGGENDSMSYQSLLNTAHGDIRNEE